MSTKQKLTIALTREQQLAVLAATGLQVKQVEVDLDALAAGDEATARLALPEWLTRAIENEKERTPDE